MHACPPRTLVLLMVVAAFSTAYPTTARADLGPENVLLLVNRQSPTSRYVARLYREYYPDIADWQILELDGLTDAAGPSSGPADEILTRQEFEGAIAQPVRDFLLGDLNRLDQILVLITTAGMPYRIEDSDPQFADAIYPAGTDFTLVGNNEGRIDAATVESELAALWIAQEPNNLSGVAYPAGIDSRIVNPYQGYRNTPFDFFNRTWPDDSPYTWYVVHSFVGSVDAPLMEGYHEPFRLPDLSINPKFFPGAQDRRFYAGMIFLTARLDGPKKQEQSPIFAVRRMLERAQKASSTHYGVDPLQANLIVDHAPLVTPIWRLDQNRTYNLSPAVEFLTGEDPDFAPDAAQARTRFDTAHAFTQVTGVSDLFFDLNVAMSDIAHDLTFIHDLREATATQPADLQEVAQTVPGRNPDQGVLAYVGFGVNGDEGHAADYISAGSDPASPFLPLVCGAICSSFESFNAATLFSDVQTRPNPQGKLVDFLAIGATGAIGYAFEPQTDALIDIEFLYYNLVADADDDGRADLTYVEAAFSALPYLSWCEIVLGDPLMRIAYGPGGMATEEVFGDVNRDGNVDPYDLWLVGQHLGGTFDHSEPDSQSLYDDRADLNQDLVVNIIDLWLLKTSLL